ncbi:MAG: hypothetical protein JXB13_22585, partial [Phycisphaerae bacterium]|nr:hypothetical protein [Phycisphaerae bacterium]
MCKSLLHLEPDWSAARKAETLQTFLGKHYFDGNGLMYSMMYWKGWREGADPRPFTMEDFDGYAYLKTSDGFTPRGHANYENSSWTAGHFLTSQCLRYRATGEEQA